MKLIDNIIEFFKSSWTATGEGAVATTMWVEGYTDDEIITEINQMREYNRKDNE